MISRTNRLGTCRQAVLVAALLAVAASVQAQSTQTIADRLIDLPDALLADVVSAEAATLPNREAGRLLVKQTLGARFDLDVDRPDFACVIHVMRWGAPDAAGVQAPEKQNWYLYSGDRQQDEEGFRGRRIAGTKNLWVMYVHLNRTAGPPYEPNYEVVVTKKAAVNVNNALALAKLFPGAGAIPEMKFAVEAATNLNTWGGAKVTVLNALPADVKVTPRADTVMKITGTAGGQQVSVDDKRTGALGDARTFDNEGRAFWDVSVGVPIGGINDLKFDDATHTASAKTIDRSTAVALLHIYLPKVDLKGTGVYVVPRPIIGVDITDRPLYKVLVGGSIGTPFANFFMAGAWTRVKDEEGNFTTDRKWQFVTGISIPVSGAAKALKGDK